MNLPEDTSAITPKFTFPAAKKAPPTLVLKKDCIAVFSSATGEGTTNSTRSYEASFNYSGNDTVSLSPVALGEWIKAYYTRG